jgi:hypothetical protein
MEWHSRWYGVGTEIGTDDQCLKNMVVAMLASLRLLSSSSDVELT